MATAALERSSDRPLRANPAARWALAVGLVAALAVPAAIVASRYVDGMTLLRAGWAAIPAALLGATAILLAGRAELLVERTLWSTGGVRQARWGKRLGALGLCFAFTAGVSLSFYGLMLLLQS